MTSFDTDLERFRDRERIRQHATRLTPCACCGEATPDPEDATHGPHAGEPLCERCHELPWYDEAYVALYPDGRWESYGGEADTLSGHIDDRWPPEEVGSALNDSRDARCEVCEAPTVGPCESCGFDSGRGAA